MIKSLILFAALSGFAGTSIWASYAGAGVPTPEKEPVSIREGSVRKGKLVGRAGTHFFIGGGLHSGK